jgi:hypothetical protein
MTKNPNFKNRSLPIPFFGYLGNNWVLNCWWTSYIDVLTTRRVENNCVCVAYIHIRLPMRFNTEHSIEQSSGENWKLKSVNRNWHLRTECNAMQACEFTIRWWKAVAEGCMSAIYSMTLLCLRLFCKCVALFFTFSSCKPALEKFQEIIYCLQEYVVECIKLRRSQISQPQLCMYAPVSSRSRKSRRGDEFCTTEIIYFIW